MRVHLIQRLPQRLRELTLWDGSPLPGQLQQRLLREHERMEVVEQHVRQLEQQRAALVRQGTAPALAMVRRLQGLRAIGPNGAWLTVMELFAWRRIRNRRQLGSLAGLAPTPYQSGGDDREQGISKAGNRRVRTMMVELAWCWLRFQPTSELSLWFTRRFALGSRRMRRIGIVALAPKLLVQLWRYLGRQQPLDPVDVPRAVGLERRQLPVKMSGVLIFDARCVDHAPERPLSRGVTNPHGQQPPGVEPIVLGSSPSAVDLDARGVHHHVGVKPTTIRHRVPNSMGFEPEFVRAVMTNG